MITKFSACDELCVCVCVCVCVCGVTLNVAVLVITQAQCILPNLEPEMSQNPWIMTRNAATVYAIFTWKEQVKHLNTRVTFKVLRAETVLMLLFWVKSPCELVDRRHDGSSESRHITSVLKMEAESSSETLISANRSTRRLNPKEHRQILNIPIYFLFVPRDPSPLNTF
jgi:hypothetical protein